MELELRRKQVSLVTLGTGVILFGAWSALRTVLYIWTGPPLEIDQNASPSMLLLVKVIAFLIIGLILLAGFSFRLYIGRSARREGMEGVQKNAYLYLSAFLLLFNFFISMSSLYFAFTRGLTGHTWLDFTVTSLVDLTSTFLLGDLLVTARRLRKLRRQPEE